MSHSSTTSFVEQPLALRLPLFGSRLIEASAGTGKTWTIAALYLRLVLGHGATPALGADLLDARSSREPLVPSQILVMTFTRAATQELNARIRDRLSEAARFFRGELDESQADALLHGLRECYPPGPLRELAAWRLANAADTMDEAAIYTIDAWCNKVLQSYASLTGSLNGDALGGDTQTLWQWAALDFWRNQVYPLEGDALDAVLRLWPDAEYWLAQSGAWQGKAQPSSMVQNEREDAPNQTFIVPTLKQWLPQQLKEQGQVLSALAAGWPEKLVQLRQWLDVQTDKEGPTGKHWSGVKLKPQSYHQWLDALAQWANNPSAAVGGVHDKQLWRLTPEGLADARTSKAPALHVSEIPAASADLEVLLQALQALPSVEQGIARIAMQYTHLRWQELKKQQQAMDFSDLLVRVQQALTSDQGAVLRQRLLAEYPVAMIDEFQDTSPGQYQVFHDLYRPQDNDAAQALLLIGDPKQSIYRFRGADIYSYLAAKQETQGRHYALDTNFRSTQAVVDAVNHVFQQAEERAGPGAFFFRASASDHAAENRSEAPETTKALQANPLPFVPVMANGLRETLQDWLGKRVPALTIATQQEGQSTELGCDWFAQCCAEQVVRWLQEERLQFGQPSQDQANTSNRALQPGDIAILVHRRRDAVRVQQALRQRGLSSVYLSDRESVYASAQAQDVVAWLQAVAEPADVALARAALATPLLGLSQVELLAYADQEELLDDWLQLLQHLHGVWRKQGVLPMLRQLVHQRALASQWLAADDGLGERKLTNVLHLAELLQHASQAHEGEQGLIRFLVQQIHLAGQVSGALEAEEQTVRLESDARLIQIVTIHKSKGLEYPVVMLPFGSYMKPVKKTASDGLWSDVASEESDTQDSGPQPDSDDERLREDLRLLYVALTRARHALWVGFPVNRRTNSKKGSELHRSALGYLLCGQAEQAVDDAAWWPMVQAWQAQCVDIAGQLLPMPQASEDAAQVIWPLHKYQAPQEVVHWRPRHIYPQGLDQQFAIASFSMLARGAQQQLAPLHAGEADTWAPEELQPQPDTETAFLWQPAARLADDEAQGATVASTPYAEQGAPTLTATEDVARAPWHALAGSSRLGDWMHQALELLQSEGFPVVPTDGLWQRLLRRAQQAGFEAQWPSLQQWLQGIVQTALPLQSSVWQGEAVEVVPHLPVRPPMRLGDFSQTLSELEFWLPVTNAHATQLDALCRQYCWPGHARPTLTRREWHGMLMGFADLVVESEGRYWVLDYKTNRLGDSAASYTPQALRDAVLHHRYDLQAMLYLQALHRLLQTRLPGYVPEQHLGGAMYWFLRGIEHESAGVIHFETPTALLMAMDAALGHTHTAAPATQTDGGHDQAAQTA
ncbi:exodeoxyribonuclease V subunit beta [Lampropedia puyangensis]|uniref:RecBCD enzyme subunit RecB n=1 Tax=Lampropedia puyangensis TaxID=1330072 RepID=A0A4V4GSJ8_9BURK|nr:exodeoxyribonuclease V subunit beta [Lampropedia puyangensis]THU05146.1 exodeoxyribonuclease V subunit beta [Lampropedia puyangensis]